MDQSSCSAPERSAPGAPRDGSSAFAPIAIIGLGCRFPKAPNIGAFWRMMLDGVDAISEVPPDRWDVEMFYDPRPATPCRIVTRNGGFVDHIDSFDPYFFGISPREAVRMDPQQRLLLEVTWEAMEYAGIPRERFVGSHTGVFMGVCTDDYITLERGDLKNIDIYLGTGGARGSTAGRLAFIYGLSGPTAAIDTACSSSLVAVHQACNALQQGDCDMALAGGVNVVLHPGTAIAFSQAGMLSPDGHCKAFDASADGFVRSEGAGVVLLKPLVAALRDGDSVYSVIRATASNNDGCSSPFMTPSRTGQAALLRHAYERAGVAPSSVQYVEAHGTGTAVGDPVEMGAITDVLAEGRTSEQRCLIGSSKTNIGHTEAAAGIAGLIKTTLSLSQRTIPPNLHFTTPNPNIPWSEIPFSIPTTVTPWPAHDGRARAGVNSFGISGTNAHVVLEEAPALRETESSEASDASGDDAQLLVLSAHTSDALDEVVRAHRDLLRGEGAQRVTPPALRGLCASAARRRTHHEQRVAVVGSSADEIANRLDALLAGDSPAGVVRGAATDALRPPVFVFSGIGTQWATMGPRLCDAEPVFRDSMVECDRIIREITGWSVLEEIDRAADASRLQRIDIMQPAIFSVQVSLAKLWRSWGVEPAAVLGHSLGEIAAAHVAGALSLTDAARVVCARSRLMHRTSGRGRMAAVGLSADDAARRIAQYDGRIDVAAVNSATSCAVSGDIDAIDDLARTLEREGVFCRVLKVDVACHSHQMEPLRAELAATLVGITPRAADIPFFSSVCGAPIDGATLGPQYWGRNLRQAVRFADAFGAALEQGHRSFVEVSPNPALLTPMRQAAKQRTTSITVAGSLRAGEPERDTLLETLGTLHVNGYALDWTRLDIDGALVPPPPYPWQRERFWFGDAKDNQAWLLGGGASRSHRTRHPILTLRWDLAESPGTHVFEGEIDLRLLPALRDHRVEGMPLLPAAAYVEMALAASMELFGDGARIVRDVTLAKALFLNADHPTRVQLVVSTSESSSRMVAAGASAAPRTMRFHFFARDAAIGDASHETHETHEWTAIASGRVEVADASVLDHGVEFSPDGLDVRYEAQQTGAEFYSSVITGMEFGPAFQGVLRAWTRKKHAVTLIQLPASTRAEARSYRMHPALLDACFHSLNATRSTDDKGRLSLPFAIESFELCRLPDPAESLWCELSLASVEGGYRAEMAMYDEHGHAVVRVHGYQTKLLEAKNDAAASVTEWLYETRWRAVERGAARAPAGRWLVLGRADGDAESISATLRERGASCVHVDARTRDELHAALRASGDDAAWTGIVTTTMLDLPVDAPSSGAALEDAALRGCVAVLDLVHACGDVAWSDPPRLFILTRNAKQADVSDEQIEPAQAPITGLARVAAIEHRELRVTQVDVDSRIGASLIVDELLGADVEHEVVLRGDARFVPRLTRLDTHDRAESVTVRISDEGSHSYRLESARTGVFDDLSLQLNPRDPPGPGQVEIRVLAVGLNFLDVLKALNMAPGLPEGADFFGMECSGRVVAVGAGVTDVRVGDEVIALDTSASGCFRAFLTTSATSVFPRPAALSFEEAATIPIAYQTAYYALCDLGRIRAGESVLIHSAAGGVGLAAVNIAKARGAVIFATAGTEEKREYLRSLGIEHVMSSRTLDFADEIMRDTNGRGVDLVLNSLAGEAIPKSLGVLATGGRFLEIGKRDIYADSQIGLLPFQRNLSFFAVDLLRMRLEKPQVVEELTRDIARFIHDGTFRPLPFTTFPASRVADAFRYMAQGKHRGKIVITLTEPDVTVQSTPRAVPIVGDATYLVTGGLGALGLAFAQRLVEQGARHLVLAGRRAPSESAAAIIDALRTRGAEVVVVSLDVAGEQAVATMLDEIRRSMPPLRGVLHAAGITDDHTIRQLRAEHFASVLAPKVAGAWNLHTHLADDDLDFLVLFSSAASVLGGAGQANYAAANAFLDALAHERRRAGRVALSINWGPWADIGMAAQEEVRGGRLAERGLESIPVKEGVELLDVLLQQRPAQVAVMPIAWDVWATQFPEAVKIPFLAELSSEWGGHVARQASSESVRQAIVACDSRASALELLHVHLRRDIARVLRIAEERLGPKVSLLRMGLDSLMAVELKNRIETDFGVRLSPARLLQGPSVSDLAEWICGEVWSTVPAPASEADSTAPLPDASPVDAMSDDEVDAMLARMLATESTG